MTNEWVTHNSSVEVKVRSHEIDMAPSSALLIAEEYDSELRPVSKRQK